MFKFYKALFSQFFMFKMADDEMSLDEAMNAVFDEMEGREDDDEDTVESDNKVEIEADKSQLSQDEVEQDDLEDKPDNDKQAAKVKSKQPDEALPDAEQPEIDPAENKTDEVRPPSSWRAQAKADFYNLPEHIQQEIIKREGDFHNGIKDYKETAEFGRSVQDIVNPYLPIMNARGIAPQQHIKNLLNTSYILETATPEQKGQLLMQVAQQYGAKMPNMGQQQRGVESQPQYVQQLQQQVQQLQQMIYGQQQHAQQQAMTETNGSIESFRSAKDEAGKLKHIFFDDVRSDMANLIEMAGQQGRQLSLEDAYDQAIWMRPDIRATLSKSQQQELQGKRKQEQSQKAADAKRKSRVNVPKTGNNASNRAAKAAGSLEDEMSRIMDDIESRG